MSVTGRRPPARRDFKRAQLFRGVRWHPCGLRFAGHACASYRDYRRFALSKAKLS